MKVIAEITERTTLVFRLNHFLTTLSTNMSINHTVRVVCPSLRESSRTEWRDTNLFREILAMGGADVSNNMGFLECLHINIYVGCVHNSNEQARSRHKRSGPELDHHSRHDRIVHDGVVCRYRNSVCDYRNMPKICGCRHRMCG